MVAEISEFVEGTLSDELCMELEQHLQGCSNCRVVVDTLKKTIELYQETSEANLSLPESVRERLFMRLNLDDYLKQQIY